MAVTTIVKEGAFDHDVREQVNANFSSLSGSTAGGALTSAHLLVGDGSNVATDVAMSGDVAIDNAGATSIATGITTHKLPAGVAAGYVVARGITALDGSNPTSVATGLTTVTGFAATVNATTGTAVVTVTYGTISGGTVPIYGWLADGSASTGTNNVAWVAVGT